jgi:hypothetical protein
MKMNKTRCKRRLGIAIVMALFGGINANAAGSMQPRIGEQTEREAAVIARIGSVYESFLKRMEEGKNGEGVPLRLAARKILTPALGKTKDSAVSIISGGIRAFIATDVGLPWQLNFLEAALCDQLMVNLGLYGFGYEEKKMMIVLDKLRNQLIGTAAIKIQAPMSMEGKRLAEALERRTEYMRYVYRFIIIERSMDFGHPIMAKRGAIRDGIRASHDKLLRSALNIEAGMSGIYTPLSIPFVMISAEHGPKLHTLEWDNHSMPRVKEYNIRTKIIGASRTSLECFLNTALQMISEIPDLYYLITEYPGNSGIPDRFGDGAEQEEIVMGLKGILNAIGGGDQRALNDAKTRFYRNMSGWSKLSSMASGEHDSKTMQYDLINQVIERIEAVYGISEFLGKSYMAETIDFHRGIRAGGSVAHERNERLVAALLKWRGWISFDQGNDTWEDYKNKRFNGITLKQLLKGQSSDLTGDGLAKYLAVWNEDEWLGGWSEITDKTRMRERREKRKQLQMIIEDAKEAVGKTGSDDRIIQLVMGDARTKEAIDNLKKEMGLIDTLSDEGVSASQNPNLGIWIKNWHETRRALEIRSRIEVMDNNPGKDKQTRNISSLPPIWILKYGEMTC